VLDIKLKLRPGHADERDWMSPSPLMTLFWNMTYACNFDCGICFTDSGAERPMELGTREAMDLLRAAREAGIGDILISGGEPFMRKDIIPILAGMGELGVTARIASNGSLLDGETLGRLKGETLVKSFQISLDTANPEIYAILHGTSPEMHSRVMSHLALIQAFGFHTTVSVRLTPLTLDGIPDLLDIAAREGWSTVTVHCPLHTNRADGAFGQAEDVLAMLEPALEHFASLEPHWLVETYIPWAEYHPVIRRMKDRIHFLHRGCRAGRDRLTVNPTGLLSPCVCLDVPAACIGDVRKDRLADVFASSPLCQLFRNPAAHGICADCPDVGRCGGGCRASAFALSGKIDGQDSSCPVWKAGAAGKARS
jgi:radical SAM protein with 4Fe4S-binding SPASM domain